MSLDEYWYGPVDLAIYYRKAFYLKRDNKNAELWLQGMYFYDAIGKALANAFLEKGKTPYQYMKEPIPLTAEEAKRQKEEAEKERMERIIAGIKAAVKVNKVKKQEGTSDG